MNQKYEQIVAIDVGKELLSIYLGERVTEVNNNTNGYEKILTTLGSPERALVVCEASGGYEQKLLKWFRSRGIATYVANPATVRSFAKGKGIRIKKDSVDASVIWSYAVENKIDASRVPSEIEEQVAALLDRRHHLSRELNREKNRKEKNPSYTLPFIEKSIEFIEEQIREIDQCMDDLIAQDEPLKQSTEHLTQIKGVGTLTAITVLAYLPELSSVGRNQAVSLAGLAPYDNDSGKLQGKRHIQGGRAKVRRCLYMAALSAARWNPVIRDYVAKLIKRGKPFKCAIVAAMRKLIICMQSLLRNPGKKLEENDETVPVSA
jgi:transposase